MARAQALTGDRAGPATAAQRLEDMFSGRGGSASRRPIVVLVDEMDLLVNKTQVLACPPPEGAVGRAGCAPRICMRSKGTAGGSGGMG